MGGLLHLVQRGGLGPSCNVTAHPSTASVPITALLYDGPLLCGFNVVIKGLKLRRTVFYDIFYHLLYSGRRIFIKTGAIIDTSIWTNSLYLSGRRLPARRRRQCQTSAFCRHSNTRCQSDAQQFWRQDLCCRRTTSLEQSAAQSQTMWAVIRPVQAVTADIFIQTVRPRCTVKTAPNRNILAYLLIYLLTLSFI